MKPGVRKFLLAALLLAVVASGCNLGVPENPIETDWCYTFNFLESDYGAVINAGFWEDGVGFYDDETGNLSLLYTHDGFVQPAQIIVTVTRHTGVTGDINVSGSGTVFGIAVSFSGTIPDGFESIQQAFSPTSAGLNGQTASISIQTSNTLDLVTLTVYGNGVNPFPFNSCGDPTLVPAGTSTITPSWSPSPSPTPTATATPTEWVHIFDLTTSTYGISGQLAGTLVPGVGLRSVTDPWNSAYESVVWVHVVNRNWSTSPTTITYARVDYQNPVSAGPAIYFLGGEGGMPFGYNEFHTYQGGDGDQSFTATTVPWAVDIGIGIENRFFGFALTTEVNKHVKYYAYRFEMRGTGYDPFTGLNSATSTPTSTATPTWFLSATPTPQPTDSRTPIIVASPTQSPIPGTSTNTGVPAPTATLTDFPTLVPFPTAISTPVGGGGDPEDTGEINILNAIGEFFAWVINSASNFFIWIGSFAGWLGGIISNIITLVGNLLQSILAFIQFIVNVINELIALIQLVIAIVGHLITLFSLWLQQLITLMQAILAAWYSTFPTPIPGLPYCVTAPMDSDACAIFYLLDNTIFSGVVGAAIMLIMLVIIDLGTIFYFARTVRNLIRRAEGLTKT
jgi:hypothetical protein